MSDPLDERVWESGWEEHERRQRRRMAHLTLIEKLAWLEEAHVLVRRLEASRAKQLERPEK
jgi:hypothetical protein